MAELAADHFVAGASVALHVDAAHIGAPPRIRLDHQRHTVGRTIDLRQRFHLGERITVVAKVFGEGLGGFCHLIGVVRLTRLDGDERFELVVLVEVIAFERDAGHDKAVTFGDVDGDRDGFLVGRHGHLGGIDLEIEVATCQVEGAQRLQIGIQLGARILVGFRIPRQPAA